MKRFIVVWAFTPVLVGAQVPGPQAWFTTIGEVRATRDGWVEWRSPTGSARPRRSDESSAVAALFTPDAAQRWVEATRRALTDTANRAARTSVPRLIGAGGSIAFRIVRDSTHVTYDLVASSCHYSLGSSASRGEVRLLVDAMTEAARVASSLSPTPSARGDGLFFASEVPCEASQRRVYMPAWSPTMGKRPADRWETLARFVITEAGRVDSTTLVWDRALPLAAERAAKATMADWLFAPASIGTQQVRQWAHLQIWFADSADAAEWQLAGRMRRRSFVARRDGRIDHTWLLGGDSLWHQREEPRIREAFTPSMVRSWLGSQGTPDQRGIALSAPGGFTREAGGSYGGCAAVIGWLTHPIPEDVWSHLADSVRAVLDEVERRPLLPVDSTRVHGETEVTCPAYPRELLPATLTRSPNAQEVILSFVVGRDGRVNASRAVLQGALTAGDAALIRAALAAQRWEPGRFAGVRVPQRAHLVLPPATDLRPSLATMSCAQSWSVAVRVRVREPAQGIASTDLTHIAHALARELSPQGSRYATDGTFGLVLDEIGAAHFFSWLRAPSDSGGDRTPEFVVRSVWAHRGIANLKEQAVPGFAPGLPLALEADLLPVCP